MSSAWFSFVEITFYWFAIIYAGRRQMQPRDIWYTKDICKFPWRRIFKKKILLRFFKDFSRILEGFSMIFSISKDFWLIFLGIFYEFMELKPFCFPKFSENVRLVVLELSNSDNIDTVVSHLSHFVFRNFEAIAKRLLGGLCTFSYNSNSGFRLKLHTHESVL